MTKRSRYTASAIVVALAVLTFGGAPVAQAGHGCGGHQAQPLIGGCDNIPTTETRIGNLAAANGNGRALSLFASQQAGGDGLYSVGYGPGGAGVRAYAYGDEGIVGTALHSNQYGWTGTNGVHGVTDNPNASGVFGENNNTGGGFGVRGRSYGIGVSGHGTTGVAGGSSKAYGIGVLGEADAAGAYGVYGNAGGGTGATGVYAISHNATQDALKVNGRASFTRSGKATISYPASSKVVSGVALTANSLVLATVQTNVAGVWVARAVPNAATSSFTVYLNKAPGTASVPKSVAVAWFIVN